MSDKKNSKMRGKK